MASVQPMSLTHRCTRDLTVLVWDPEKLYWYCPKCGLIYTQYPAPVTTEA